MFRTRVIPVWVGILVLSGMFLLGQDTWGPPPECVVDADCDNGNVCTDDACVNGVCVNVCNATGLADPCCADPACLGNPVCVTGPMFLIPAGCFEMGDHFNEGWSDELPVHQVCISAFQMDVYEVTNAQYEACVAAGVCTVPLYSFSYSRPSYYGNPAYDDFPVIYVNWHQAKAYCAWAGNRLPTEAEWEYAARGGLGGKRYPWGDTSTCDDACYGRFDSASECWNHCHSGVCDNDTHPVGNYAPNGYGLYDMAGNVWEWTNDRYDGGYYQYCVDNGIVNDPPGPNFGTDRSVRGGSLNSPTIFLRAAFRYHHSPGWNGSHDGGFRCAR